MMPSFLLNTALPTDEVRPLCQKPPSPTKEIERRLAPTGYRLTESMTQHLDAAIVPVGCSGSDHLYPGDLPLSKGGRVTYRIGAPLEPDGPELGPHRVPSAVLPLTRAANERYGDRYEAITEVVMAKIGELVDPEYGPAPEAKAGESGIDRFI